MIIVENIFLKNQIYNKLVTVWLSYHLFVTKGLFKLLPMQALPFSITKIHVSSKFQLP